jgi:hypothetical protein
VRLNTILAVLLVISTFSFAQGVENRINRPWNESLTWEQNNPFVTFYSFEQILDSPTCITNPASCSALYLKSYLYENVPLYDYQMNYSLETLDLDSSAKLGSIPDEISEKIELAKENQVEGSEKIKAAEDDIYRALGEIPGEAVGGFVGGCTVGALALMGVGTVTLPVVGTVAGSLVGCIGGGLIGAIGTTLIGSADAFASSLNAMEALYEYGNYWKATMDYALDALEMSLDEADNSVNNLIVTYNEMQGTGICDEDYSWEPRDACLDISTAITAIETGDTEVNYGKYNTLLGYGSNISEEVYNHVPDMSLYYPAMELVWADDGVVATFDSLDEHGKDAIEEADRIYADTKTEADDSKTLFDEKFSGLEDERLDLIMDSTILEELGQERMKGSIAERYSSIQEQKEEAEKAYADAQSSYNFREHGYLKYATNNISAANSLYESLNEEIDLLEEDAKDLVSDLKLEAQQEINSASARLASLGITDYQLDEAESELAAGNSADSLGERYVHYANAKQLASIAAGEWTLSDAVEVQSLIYEIESLIERAETDGLNVAGEKGELELLKSNTGSADIMLRLTSLKNGIISKAGIVYGDLETKRRILLDKLTLAGEDELIGRMQTAEVGIVFNNMINYEYGLGKLGALRATYDGIEEELEADPEIDAKAVSAGIVTDVSLAIDRVKIDEPTDVLLNIIFKNTRDYWGEDVEVAVPLSGDFQFDYFDITEGAEEVTGLRTERNVMYITLGFVDSYDMKSVTFENSDVLARTVSEESSAEGLGDGSAKVEESTTFDLYVSEVYVEVPEYGATDVRIDNLGANRPLSKGIHTITRSYTDYNAYSEERSDATSINLGTETKMEYSITITPNIDLDSVPVFIDLEENDYLSDVSVSCSGYSYTDEDNPQGHMVEIYNLVEGHSATIGVSYTVSELDDYVNEEFSKIEGISSEPEVVSMVENARNMIAFGDYTSALLKIEEIKKKIAEIDKSKSKLVKKHSELVRDINAELRDLEAALNKANETNHSLIDRFETRKAELEEILNASAISSSSLLSEIQYAIDELEKIDKNWLKKQVSTFKKDATKELNNYRKEFFGFDNATAVKLLDTLEHDINVLAATEKAEDAVNVVIGLEEAENVLGNLEAEKLISIEELRIEFEGLRDDVEETLEKYSSESGSAKGTGVEQLFTVKDSSVTKLISDIEKNIGVKSNDYIEKKMEDLGELDRKMQDALSGEKSAAERKLYTIKSVYNEKRDSIPENDQEYISGQIGEIEILLSHGQYANAIAKSDNLIERIDEAIEEDSNFIFLLVASVLVLAMVIIYMIRQQKPKRKIGKEKEK